MAPSIYDWSSTASDNGTADADINFAEGQTPSSVNDSARMLMKRVRDLVTDIGGSMAVGGTANALTLTNATGFTALEDGLIIGFRAASDNTAAATLNVNALGAKSLRKMSLSGDVALSGGEVQATGIYLAVYSEALNSAAGAWLLLNPTDTLPDVAAAIVAADAKATPVDADSFGLVDSAASNALKEITWAQIKAALKTYFDTLYATTTHTHTVTEGGSWLLSLPQDGSYTLALKMPFGGTISETTTKSASGTCTATFKINSTPLGGTANSVSTGEQSQAHASANAFAAGDDLVVTIASNAACRDASLSIKWTRTI